MNRRKLRISIDLAIPLEAVTETFAILGAMAGQVLNFYQFAFWTGLRPSEQIALRWPDVSLPERVGRVLRAKTRRRVDAPKTEAGERDFRILGPAAEALERQRAETYLEGREVFHNPRTGNPWASEKALREVDWTRALKKACVRYRYPYQCRHTYASMMLSAGERPAWVASQMGHRDLKTFFSRYARWIPEVDPDAGSRAEQIWKTEGIR